MTYVRHRDRMIHESVYEDLRDSLIAMRWLAGTTSRPIHAMGQSPDAAPAVITTTDGQVLPLLEKPLVLLDYFPQYEDDKVDIAVNTFALGTGRPGAESPLELGSRSVVQEYTFNMAFFAASEGAAVAVFNDLRDRYRGLQVRGDYVGLYDYNGEATTPVVRMEVESFRYEPSTDDTAAPYEVTLYFGELVLSDINES